MFTPAPPKAGRCRVLYVSPLKALAVDVERNLRAPLAGIAQIAAGARRRARRAGDRDPHRRHAAGRARAVSARAGRHPDHDAGVAVPAADVQRARGAALGRHDHHRRDPRAGADQARRAPRAVARAARGDLRAPAAAHRPVGDAAPARRGRALPRRARDRPQIRNQIRNPQSAIRNSPGRHRDRARVFRPSSRPLPACHHRRRRPEQGAEADDRSAGRGHGEGDEADEIPSGPGRRWATRGRRSGRRSTRGCSRSSARTARR